MTQIIIPPTRSCRHLDNIFCAFCAFLWLIFFCASLWQKVSPRKLTGRYRFRGLFVAPSPRPLTEIRDPSTSNLRSGCTQQHFQRGAEHCPCLITTNHRKLVQERIHRLIIFKKLEEQSDWNCRTDKHYAATTLSRVAFNHVFEIHLPSRTPESAEASPMRRMLLRTQPGPPPGYPDLIFDLQLG